MTPADATHLVDRKSIREKKKAQDQIAVQIDAIIRANCEPIASDLGFVFAAELLKYATNFWIIKTEDKIYEQKLNFPYLNSDYVQNIPSIPFKIISEHQSIKERCLELIGSFSSNIECSSNLGFSRWQLILASQARYCPVKSTRTQFYVPDRKLQIEKLGHLLMELSKLVEEEDRPAFRKNFIQYVESFLTDEDVPPTSPTCILGSNVDIRCRVIAATYMQHSLPVICIGHGHQSFFVFDEPIIGLGELSLCTDYLTYGRLGIDSDAVFSKPIGSPPQIHFFSSSSVKEIHSLTNIKARPIRPETKILYLPTGFADNYRYGPFRDLDDRDYAYWQDQLLRSGYNIFYKSHPKNKSNLIPPSAKIVSGRLEDIIDSYDVIALDFVSTASSIAISTDKPILYFDLGLRKLSPHTQDAFRGRVHWTEINLDSEIPTQIRSGVTLYNQRQPDQTNKFSKLFSLSENGLSNVEALTNLLDNKLSSRSK